MNEVIPMISLVTIWTSTRYYNIVDPVACAVDYIPMDYLLYNGGVYLQISFTYSTYPSSASLLATTHLSSGSFSLFVFIF